MYRFHRKSEQLLRFSASLKSEALTGGLRQLPARKGLSLIKRVKRLQRQLLSLRPEFRFSKVFAASVMALSLVFGKVQAQSFDTIQVNPFGLVAPGYWSSPAFADIDDDGDLDLMVGRQGSYGELLVFLNNDRNCPQVDAPVTNPYGFTTQLNDFAFVTVGHLDDDGDMDLIAGDNSNDLHYYENTGSATNPQFSSPQINPFGISMAPYAFLIVPNLADLDGDADLDLLVGDQAGEFIYFENTGSATAPSFGPYSINPFGLNSLGLNKYNSSPALTDLDKDGDLDLLSGMYDYGQGEGHLVYYENTGTATSPAFASPVLNPFGIVSTGYFGIPGAGDLDLDGDVDIIVGFGDEDQLGYYENSAVSPTPPTSASATVTTTVNNPITFQLPNFTFSDTESHAFTRIQITQLPSAGTLTFNANPVTLNQIISPESVGQLVFTPQAGQSGQPYTTFRFKVGDCYDLSASSYTMTIDVTGGIGIRAIASDGMTLFPNPSSSTLTVRFDQSLADDGVIHILDAMGRFVSSTTVTGGSQDVTIDVSGLSSGLYQMVVGNHSVRLIRTFAVQ